jgi:hypothetical protein
MSIRRLAVSASVIALFVACDRQPTAVTPVEDTQISFSTNPSAMNQQLAAVRAATARYHDVDLAIQDGFVPITGCIAHPALGGMGIHYARPDRMGDADYIATEPEMLLYLPEPDGSLKLLGVEYWITKAAWDAAGRSGFPLFVDHPFDFALANAHLPDRFTLHVWIWAPNPSGMFAPFNPRISCP